MQISDFAMYSPVVFITILAGLGIIVGAVWSFYFAAARDTKNSDADSTSSVPLEDISTVSEEYAREAA